MYCADRCFAAQVDDSLFDQKPALVVSPRAAAPGAPVALHGSAMAAEAPAPKGSRFSYTDVMEQPRHEPAPSMSSDFFKDAAKPEAKGRDGGSPRFGSSGSFGRSDSSRGFGSGQPSKGVSGTAASDVAQKKFGNAKSISSDAFNERTEVNPEKEARLARFAGASSISSSDFYDGGGSSGGGGGGGSSGRSGGGGGGGSAYAGRSADYDDEQDVTASELVAKMTLQAQQDLQQLKGIAQSAGRMLSGLAASVMSELQER